MAATTSPTGSVQRERVASDLRFCSLIGQSPGVKTPADDGFVSINSGLGQAAPVVARTALPIHASMLCDRGEMSVALRYLGSPRTAVHLGGMMTAASGWRSATAS